MKEKYIYYLVILAGVLVYVCGLFPETTVDSAKYASVSREIYENGDFLHLRIHGDPYMQKPPFLFWLSALSFHLLGLSMFAFKLPTILSSLLAVYSVYRLSIFFYDRKLAIVSATVFAASEAVILYNMDVHTDMLLTSLIIFGTWQLVEYTGKRSPLNFVLGFLGVGMAVITKGLPGMFVPACAIFGYLLFERKYDRLLSPVWLAGALIICLVISPALIGLYDQFGREGITFFFWSNNIDRIKGEYSGYRHDYFFTLHTFLYLFLPWAVFLYIAFARDVTKWVKGRFRTFDPGASLCYSAVIPLAVLVSVSSQQSPHYLLPIIPFAAIITSRYLVKVSEEGSKAAYRSSLIIRDTIVVLIWLICGLVVFWFFPPSRIITWIVLILFFILQLTSYIFIGNKTAVIILPLVTAIFALGFVANACYMPSALKYHGVIQASYLYNELSEPGDNLFTYDYGQYETYFYPRNISQRLNGGDLDRAFVEERSWLICGSKGYEEIMDLYHERIVEQFEFPYKKLTNLSIRFINPATREDELKKIYLLKIQR